MSCESRRADRRPRSSWKEYHCRARLRSQSIALFCALLFLLSKYLAPGLLATDEQSAPAEPLWAAARQGDVAAVRAALENGVDVNAKTSYGVTALLFASSRGHEEVVRALLAAGAEVNVKDTFYGATALGQAIDNGHESVAARLLDGGATAGNAEFLSAVDRKYARLVRRLLQDAEISDDALRAALHQAKRENAEETVKLLEQHGVPAEAETVEVEEQRLRAYEGRYESGGGQTLEFSVTEQSLRADLPGGEDKQLSLRAIGSSKFRSTDSGYRTFEFDESSTPAGWLTMSTPTRSTRYERVNPKDTAPEEEALAPELAARLAAEDARVSSVHWPQFRGTGARGVADGQDPPTTWNVDESVNVKWKTPIAGLGLSSPVVWADRVFLTTAVGQAKKNELRIGLYGDVDSVEDDSLHRFQVICLDKTTGDVIWLRTANESKPTIKRHLKSTHANPTPATDGHHVVASFGTEGVFCYDIEGELLWRKDLGKLDSGWFYDPDYQWGFGSSPVIHDGVVFLQCDAQANSFLIALDVHDGRTIWRAERDEVPTWSSPTVVETPDGPMLVTNGTRLARGYDAETGGLLWQRGGNSEIVVPTPFFARGLTFVVSGYRNPKPVHAIRLDARGDLSDDANERDDEDETLGPDGRPSVAWSNDRAGSYLPTPLVYRDYLFVCDNRGIVTCYRATTGQLLNRRRLSGSGLSFTASPIAGDGRLYLTAENGEVHVLTATPKLESLHVNPLGEPCLTTPAVSDGILLFRCRANLIAVEQVAEEESESGNPESSSERMPDE